jgi:hypothetical protein
MTSLLVGFPRRSGSAAPNHRPPGRQRTASESLPLFYSVSRAGVSVRSGIRVLRENSGIVEKERVRLMKLLLNID